MPYVKQISIKFTLNKAINYIANLKKNHEGVLFSGVNCASNNELAFKQMVANKKKFGKEKGLLGFHFLQSFKPGEIDDPQLAHEIGLKWAEKLFQGNYQYVLSTHVDKGHVHNHIVVNSVALDGRKFDACQTSLEEARRYSDEVAKAYDLSIITPRQKGSKSKSYKEWQEDQKGSSWKSQIKIDIDDTIKRASTFEDFMKQMRGKGYQIKHGNVKYMTFQLPGMKRCVRGKTLGMEYTESSIKERIALREFQFTPHAACKKYKAKKHHFPKAIRDISFKYRYKRASLDVNFILTFALIKTVLSRNVSKPQKTKQRRVYNDQEIRQLSSHLKLIAEKEIKSRADVTREKALLKTKMNEISKVIVEANRIQEKMNVVLKDIAVYQRYQSLFENLGAKKITGELATKWNQFQEAKKQLKTKQIEEVRFSDIVKQSNSHQEKIKQLYQKQELFKQDVLHLTRIEQRLDQMKKEQEREQREQHEEHNRKGKQDKGRY